MKIINRMRELARIRKITKISNRKAGELLGCSHQTVGRDLTKLDMYQLSYPMINDMDDETLINMIKPNKSQVVNKKRIPDWAGICKKLEVKHQTLMNLWWNYYALDQRTGYGKTTFYDGYKKYCASNKVAMKMEHLPGEEVQVDYAGQTIPLWQTNQKKPLNLSVFVAVLCHSSKLFAHATLGQTTSDWIKGHIAFFEYINGLPIMIIPDNPKALVTRPRPNLVLNPKYEAFGQYYDVVIAPARPGEPQDKGLVEESVRFITERVLVNVLSMKFFSLDEVNCYLREECDRLNDLHFQKLTTSRNEKFELGDKPNLRPLPSTPFTLIEAKFVCKASSAYRIFYKEHSYSVPWQWANKQCQVTVTKDAVTISHNHKKPVIHHRSYEKGGDTILNEHQPANHRALALKSREEYLDWAFDFGDATTQFVEQLFSGKHAKSRVANIDLQVLQTLAKKYESVEFESACKFCISNLLVNRTALKQVLVSGIHKELVPTNLSGISQNELVRGSDYYSHGSI